MRIDLVCPAAEDSFRLRSLALGTLAGMTPPDVELSLLDDTVKRIDLDADIDGRTDLAGITVTTKTARRAYEIAAAYRQRGVKVVMGGIHPTALPEEALEHCDAVVVGEAEGLWERVVEDARAGRMGSIYRQPSLPDFHVARRSSRTLFPRWTYPPVHVVQASRGCPFTCEFCSVWPFFGRKTRLRDPADVADEFSTLPRGAIVFCDDNIVGYGEHSRALFKALAPFKRKWAGQASLHGMQDDSMLRAMSDSGCGSVFVGFESVSRNSLLACGKRQNDPSRYVETVRRLHDHGIAVWAAFVFGFDEDTPDVFEATVEFARKAGVMMASFSVLTPYPGTVLFNRLKAEGRLFDERWWLRDWRDGYPFFQPRNMTTEQLFEGWQNAWKWFYSGSSILARLPYTMSTSFFAAAVYLPINIFQHRLTNEKIIGGKKLFLRDG